MSCLCEIIKEIKKELALFKENTDATILDKLIKGALDKILLGAYILPTIDDWLKDANATIAVNKANLFSEDWINALLDSTWGTYNSKIFEPYWKELDTLDYLAQALERLKSEKPYNPFFNYDAMLVGIASRQAQIRAEKDLFEDMWRELHQNGAQPTRDQVESLIAAARQSYTNGYVDSNSISHLSQNLHHLVDAAVAITRNTTFGAANMFYGFVLKEHLFPTLNTWVRTVLEIRKDNMSYLHSPDFVKLLARADTYASLDFALRYYKERNALDSLETAIRDIMEQIPNNPYLDYNQALATIEKYRNFSQAESELYRKLWTLLHPDGTATTLTDAEIQKIMDKLFTECCDIDECGCGEPDCICDQPKCGDTPPLIMPKPEDPENPVHSRTYLSPVILDLDGDGVETVSVENGVYFDHDGNLFAEKTGWAGADDAFLVWDRNRNGRIDDGSELFGNNFILANGLKYQSMSLISPN